jgi:large subunit ribosomal protein L10e
MAMQFPGRQIIVVSKKWGFTKWDREDFSKGMADGSIAADGAGAQARPPHGPLSVWKSRQ